MSSNLPVVAIPPSTFYILDDERDSSYVFKAQRAKDDHGFALQELRRDRGMDTFQAKPVDGKMARYKSFPTEINVSNWIPKTLSTDSNHFT